jgi:hypothetical protein
LTPLSCVARQVNHHRLLSPTVRRPLVDLCVVHRSEEIEEEERELNLALVAVVGGSRPHVSLPEVRSWVANGYGIPRDSFKVRRFQPEDFMITFSYYDDMLLLGM